MDETPHGAARRERVILFARFDALGITHMTHRHRPVFTVEEGRDLKSSMPGGHTKNLFLKDKKGAIFLICAISSTAIDLNAVSKLIGVRTLQFRLSRSAACDYLGVDARLGDAVRADQRPRTPGRRWSSTKLCFALDPVNFHPLRTTPPPPSAPPTC